jgi:hypothetical protein
MNKLARVRPVEMHAAQEMDIVPSQHTIVRGHASNVKYTS